MKSVRGRTDLRIPAGMSVLSLLLSYICGGVLLANGNWLLALGVLVLGYGLTSALVITGKGKVQKAAPSMMVVLSANRRRFLFGLALNAVGLALLALGPGQLLGVSGSASGSFLAGGLILALYGYYFLVSSHEYRPAVNKV